MPKTIISEGKTTNEAIENGLKELNVTKNDVEIKILENTEKRSFFSILAPRVVKVEMTVKEKNISNKDKENKEKIIYNIEERRKKIEIFLEEFIKKLKNKEINYSIDIINNNNTNLDDFFDILTKFSDKTGVDFHFAVCDKYSLELAYQSN